MGRLGMIHLKLQFRWEFTDLYKIYCVFSFYILFCMNTTTIHVAREAATEEAVSHQQ